jgi:hypothetical protein
LRIVYKSQEPNALIVSKASLQEMAQASASQTGSTMCSATLMVRQYRSRLDKRLLGSSAGLTDKFSPKVIGLSALAIMLPSVAQLSRNESSCAACLILSGEIKPGLAAEEHPRFRPEYQRLLLSRHRLDLDATSMRQDLRLPAGRTLT